MIYLARYQIGRQLYYLGFRILPASHRRGLACMSALGIAWATSKEGDLLKVMSGELEIEWQWHTPKGTGS
jgi:hypothetical protein